MKHSGVQCAWSREVLLLVPVCSSFRLPVGGGSGGSTATSRLHLGFLKGDDSAPEIKLSTEETIVMCTLVCTADYCVDTTQQVLQMWWLQHDAEGYIVWLQHLETCSGLAAVACSVHTVSYCTYYTCT